jgi:formylmethanofuran dehydrogenase subunit B
MPQTEKTYRDVVCTLCGCVCDDLEVTVDREQVMSFTPGCPLAEPWMLSQTPSRVPAARINGSVTTLDEAVNHAASVLQTSRSPLVYGLSRSSTPGQRAAIRLADRLGAFVDTTASTCHAPSILALQTVGESTASLGEIQNRSDLIIYWGSNPLKSHPRHMQRFVESPGFAVPEGRAGRHVVVVDARMTETAAVADTFVQVDAGGDFDLIWALRCMIHNSSSECSRSVAGVSPEVLNHLCKLFTNCRYGAVFFGLGLTRQGVPHANVEALLRLVTDLNAHTRFVARRMRIPGDVAGADTVLCWQTGFPFSVSLSRGYPRYNPGEYSANDLLRRREVDAVVLVGAEGVEELCREAQASIKTIPNIVLEYPSIDLPYPAEVHFTTAIYGVHRHGTAYRMDEVPIALRSFFESPLPADHEVLRDILAKLD